MFRKIIHYLFKCPTFWRWNPAFTCPICNKKYRCYFDGCDIAGHGINICLSCGKKLEGV